MTSWPWLAAAFALLALGLGAATVGVATGPPRRRVTAQNTATLVVCLAFLLLAQGYGRPSYVDLALVLSVLGPAGTLVYARLLAADLERDPPKVRGAAFASAVLTVVVVVPLCVATGPSRAMGKLLVIGALLIAGNVIASVALGGGEPEEAERG
ncbi:MrpF/PhaF family protein [Streptomyces sp. NPDC004682]